MLVRTLKPYSREPDKYGLYLIQEAHSMTVDKALAATAEPDFDNKENYSIFVQVDSAGAEELTKVTEDVLGERLAILYNGHACCVPTVETRIPSGRMQIIGSSAPHDSVRGRQRRHLPRPFMRLPNMPAAAALHLAERKSPKHPHRMNSHRQSRMDYL